MAKLGRPNVTEEEYKEWLREMEPFLKLGHSLGAAIYDSGLTKHQTAIYDKYRLKDDFAQKIDIWRSLPGKLVHEVLVKIVMEVNTAIKQQIPITDEQMRNVRFYAEKSRAAQTYFVNRQETASARPIEELLEELDEGEEGINDVAAEAKKQMVASESPIQDQEQAGGSGDVSPQPDAVTVSD